MHFKLLFWLWLLTRTTAKNLPRNFNLELDDAKSPITADNEILNDAIPMEINLGKMSQKYIIPPVVPEEDISGASSDVVFDHVDFETEDAEADDTVVEQQHAYNINNTKFNIITETTVRSHEKPQKLDVNLEAVTEQLMINFEEPSTGTKNDLSLEHVFESEYLEPRTASSNIEALDENRLSEMSESVTDFEDITQSTVNEIALNSKIYNSDNIISSTNHENFENNFKEVGLTVSYTDFVPTASDENLSLRTVATVEPTFYTDDNLFVSKGYNFENTTPNLASNEEAIEKNDTQNSSQKKSILKDVTTESSHTTLPEILSDFKTLNSVQTTTASGLSSTTTLSIINSFNSTTEVEKEGLIASFISLLTGLIGLNKKASKLQELVLSNQNNTQNYTETSLNLLPFQNSNYTHQPALYFRPLNLSTLNQTKNIIGYGLFVIPRNFTYLPETWNFTTNTLSNEATSQKIYAKHGKFAQFKTATDDKPQPKHLYFGNLNNTILLNSTFWKKRNHTKFKFFNTTSNGLRPFSLFLPLKRQYLLQLQQQQQQQQRGEQNHFMGHWYKVDQKEKKELLQPQVSTFAPLELTRQSVNVAHLQHEKQIPLQFEFEIPNPLVKLYRSIFGTSLT